MQTTRLQAFQGQNQSSENIAVEILDNNNRVQDLKLQPQHNPHPGIANLDKIWQQHVVLQALKTVQMPATPVFL